MDIIRMPWIRIMWFSFTASTSLLSNEEPKGSFVAVYTAVFCYDTVPRSGMWMPKFQETILLLPLAEEIMVFTHHRT
jgi:hypothetical protein